MANDSVRTSHIFDTDQLYQDIQNTMNQSGPFFPLLQPGQIVAGSKNLTNLEYNASWLIDVAAIGTS